VHHGTSEYFEALVTIIGPESQKHLMVLRLKRGNGFLCLKIILIAFFMLSQLWYCLYNHKRFFGAHSTSILI